MIKYVFLAVIAAFGLTACGQGDSGQGDSAQGTSQQQAGGDESMTSSGDNNSNQYFEAASKVGEVQDSGLGYKYVVIEQNGDYNP